MHKITNIWAEEDKASSKSILKRSEVKKEMCWDVEAVFPSDEAFERSLADFEKELSSIKNYSGRLAESGQTLLESFQYHEGLNRQVELLYTYAHLKHDEDTAEGKYTAYVDKVMRAFSLLAASTAYIKPELVGLSDEKVEQLFAEEPGLAGYEMAMEWIRREKKHTLSEKEENILAKASRALGTARSTFSILNDADIPFPKIKDENNEEVQLSHSRLIKFLESRDRRVRKDCFEALYNTYGQFKNTFASLISGNCELHNFTADVRGFGSAREAALFDNAIPESVYDNLIATVSKNRPLLHRYVSLRKKIMGLSELHTYDMYVPLSKLDINISFEEAKEITLKALAPMGEEYLSILQKAFDEGWIDYAENQGKRSGAYSNGCYDSKPYILISWQNSLNNLYTLVHELGHSIHSYFTRREQPYRYGEYSIFLAEIASTTNENLLTAYLLQNETDKEKRIHYINHYLDGFKGTVFRQTQFAEFEYLIHKAKQEGESLTADYLSEIYGKIQRASYGPDLVFDEQIALEWSRIPHFYYNFYVYQYSTGFSAATAFAKAILDPNDKDAVKRYIGFLSAGLSKYPLDVLKDAGLDMSVPAPIEAACEVFEQYLNELETLLA